MDLRAHTDQTVGPFMVSVGPGYPYVPTLTAIDVAFGGSRVISGPDPSRMTATMWLPDSGRAALPRLNDKAMFSVELDGGGPTIAFAGRVDGVSRQRRRGPTGTPAVPITLPPLGRVRVIWNQYGVEQLLTSADTSTPGVWTITAPEVGDDGLFLDEYMTAVIPLAGNAGGISSPVFPLSPRTWLWAMEAVDPGGYLVPPLVAQPPGGPTPEPYPAPSSGHGRWWWRANGVYTPLTHGPLILGDVVPGDLALVTRMRAETSRSVSWPVIRPHIAELGKHPPGEWVQITATDDSGVLGRYRMGDTPWPVESAGDRLSRIAARARELGYPVPVTIPTGGTLGLDLAAVKVAARDVDSQPAVDLVADVAGAVGGFVIGTTMGVTVSRTVEYPLALNGDGSVSDNPDGVWFPRVPDAVLEVSSTSLANKMTVTYSDPVTDPDADPVERLVVLEDAASIRAWGESSARWSTAVTTTAAAPDPYGPAALAPVLDRLRSALHSLATPTYALAGPVNLTRSLLAKMAGRTPGYASFTRLLDARTRHGATVFLDTSGDTPAGTPREWSVAAGSIVVDEGRLSVSLSLEPAGRSGAPTMTIAELATSPARVVTINSIDPTLTIDRLAHIAPGD